MKLKILLAPLCILAATADGAAGQSLAATLRPHARQWEQIAQAEDARAASPAQLATLMDGTRSRETEIRRMAVRSLGRLERADLADSIAMFLRDPAPRVRVQAAISIAQATINDRDPAAMRGLVTNALAAERDPEVIPALLEASGRLHQPSVDVARVTVGRIASYLDRDAPIRLGAIRGLYFIMRQRQPDVRPALQDARTALIRVATGPVATTATAKHTRTLATATIVAATLSDEATLARIMRDPEGLVRREAMVATGFLPDTAGAIRLIQSGLRDTYFRVRYEALRRFGARFAKNRGCTEVMPFTRDANMHVRLLAIDLLGTSCQPNDATIAYLDSVARRLPTAAVGEWHPAAHAIVALASRDAARARARLSSFFAHPNFYVRTYGATAAGIAADTALLMRQAADAHPNVRTEAVKAISRLTGHGNDALYLEQLSNDDSQLLMAASAALDSTKRADVASRLLEALDRLTQQRRENSRDGRDALLKAAGHIGNSGLADRVRPYTRDFDPAIASRAAEVLKAWTGSEVKPEPEPLPMPSPVPAFDQAADLEGSTVSFLMASGDTIRMRLFPFDAPTNTARFARLARTGEFDNRTLHRVEPNFVVQGGSANANEYRGAPDFSRDEIAVPNWRGTVGLSTRGHDTGDGQIYINLVDDTLLDPLFTVYAEVTDGLNSVDQFLEGVTIRKAFLSDK